MPRKHKTEEAVAQNRESQRRSRARRKEYMESLQQRVQELERRGVEATLAMQQAALRVTKENELLRQLLYQQGLSKSDIAGYISAALGLQHSEESLHSHQESPLCVNELSEVMSKSPSASNSSSEPPELPPLMTEDFYPAERSEDTADTKHSPPGTMEISCEEAAVIIAGIRGETDSVEQIRTALGCSDRAVPCMVKNVRVFQLIDTL